MGAVAVIDNALEAEVKSKHGQRPKLFGEQTIVPDGIFGKAIVGDHEGAGLRLSQMIESDGRYFAPSELMTCQYASMSRDHLVVRIDQHRYVEPEDFNAFCNLANLSRTMEPGVHRIELQSGNPALNYLIETI